ncbi:MAG: DNA recombination protein RmuC [Bacteroidota bacterium]
MDIAFLLLGITIGALSTWFIAKYHFSASKQHLTHDEVQERYVLKELHQQLQRQLDVQKDDLMEKDQENRQMGQLLSARDQEVRHLKERQEEHQQELNQMHQQFKLEFEHIANRLLEEKSQKFTQQNQRQLNELLDPLKDRIKEFESGIEKRYLDETRDKASLKKEIEQLRALNQQLSQDAHNLVAALKGENKTQGDWGEYQLEMLLQRAGLVKNIHFLTQASFKDGNGQDKRPDFIINLPEERHLIIDSKVSLVAYERYFNSQEEDQKSTYLKAHIDSIRKHIRDLASKNYPQLYQINSPDYLLLFVPIEPAFTTAIHQEPKLFVEALDRNIVLVTTSTLLATMRTVSYIWKQEKQKKSVLEIARQSGLLYDKFCNFVDDLKTIGARLDSARNAHDLAMNKLVDARRYGDSLIGRAQKIKELGAKSSKSLPRDLIDQVDASKNGLE